MSAEARIVVVSDRAYQGIREDATGPRLVKELERQGYTLGSDPIRVVPDELDVIEECLLTLVADPEVRLVVTTGGTGAATRDVTPEATRRVVEKELPGFGELMRSESRKQTRLAAASRGLAGTRGAVLIVNLPGSPSGALECLGFIAEPARHVIGLISGTVIDCQTEREGQPG